LLVARGGEADHQKKTLASSRNLTLQGTTQIEDDRQSVGLASARSRMNLEQDNLFFTHVRALWSKRAANFRRDKKAWVCTTVLPSLFVLVGLLLFKLSPQNRALEPLELKLEDYNAGVESGPRNPITVNNVNDVFQCQPGICSYSSGNFPLVDTQKNITYTVCGVHSLVNDNVATADISNLSNLNMGNFGTGEVTEDSFRTCSVNQVTKFMETITESGVTIVEVDATTLTNVSRFFVQADQ